MIVQLNISDVILQPELNAAQITITPTFYTGIGITPEERAKLAEYPELTGDPNKFVSDDGTVKEITSSIGVVGTDLYASVEPSTLLAGAYQLKQAIDPTETEMTIISGGGAIVSGVKFIDENPAQAFPMGTIGFNYWRKISSLAGESRKGLRFFLFDTSDNSETDIFAPLWSSPIEVTDFAERQISYSVPSVSPTATLHYGVEFLFTATGSTKTLTYIVGDGRGWFMRLPLPLKHEKLTDKNSEAAVQHVDTTVTKEALAEADKVAIYDSVTGEVVLTKKNNIDESFKKLAVRRGAVFNEATGFYELNGLTDITEEQMMDIYTYTSSAINADSLDQVFSGLPIRTNYMTSNRRGFIGMSAKYAFRSSSIEVFKQNDLLINNGVEMFSYCAELKIVDYISPVSTNASFYTYMFINCTALETCFLRSIKANLSFQWSPLLSLASLQYIIQYRGNGTTQITITVHPTVFAKLTDNVNYPTWYAVAQDALTKFITFATV